MNGQTRESGATGVNVDQLAKKRVADLYRLAFLFTGRSDVSIDIAVDAALEHDSSRRVVITEALSAMRSELWDSARRMEHTAMNRCTASDSGYSITPETTKAQFEDA